MGPDGEGLGGDLLCKNGCQLSMISEQGADLSRFFSEELTILASE